MQETTGSIVEGIGDEVIWGSVVCLLTVIPIAVAFYLWNKNRLSQQVIHPESQENVQNVRERLREQNRLPPGRMSSRQNDQELLCPICIVRPTFAIETNCGHVFCGMCMITYWQHGSWRGTVRCPVCRQSVTLMLFLFNEEELNTSSAEKDDVVSNINTYNRRFSGEPREFMEYVRDLPMLLRHLIGEFFSLHGLIFMFRLRIVVLFLVVLVYFVSPLDLIPEAVFGILGFLDDFFVLMLFIIYLSIIYRRLVALRAEGITD